MEIMVRKCLWITLLVSLWATQALAAGFDCAKAATKVEKLICNDPALSQLDDQLSQKYIETQASSSDKDAVKKQQLDWLKNARNACESVDCLKTAYADRLAQLGNSSVSTAGALATTDTKYRKNPNARITEGKGVPICEEYLKVLNRAAWDDLQVCRLPSLSGSSIARASFSALNSSDLKYIDKMVYGMLTDDKSWDTTWPKRQVDYLSERIKIGEIRFDIDADGREDRVFEFQQPERRCIELHGETYKIAKAKRDAQWESMGATEKIESEKIYGMATNYYALRNGALSYVSASNLVFYKGELFSVWNDLLGLKSINDNSSREYVRISTINSEWDSSIPEYHEGPTICKFWIN
jgi:uncharacterized protein